MWLFFTKDANQQIILLVCWFVYCEAMFNYEKIALQREPITCFSQ
ncbi:hypothetical protein LAC1533_0698 [Ligilactobacillus acidipiscis]|uniref:Uncharacterized protein n=1 Tax=Ligilactobacillus acidipiscis TaxID=89059 RepID=A0A1K1KMI4_9LACO|nr:hypothetical protein LAC1533_0698 [Ligilactobacillus acidipiscis]